MTSDLIDQVPRSEALRLVMVAMLTGMAITEELLVRECEKARVQAETLRKKYPWMKQ